MKAWYLGVLYSAGAYAAEMPSLLVVNGVDATLDLLDMEQGHLRRNIAPLPTYATDVAILHQFAYVTGSGDSSISRINLETEFVDANWVQLPPLSGPWGISVYDDHTAWVVLSGLDAAQKFNPSTGELRGGPVPVGNFPEGCTIYGNKLFVAVTGLDFDSFQYVDPGVAVLDVDTGDLLGRIDTAPNPQDVTGWGGKIFTVCTGDYASIESAVAVVDAENLSLLSTMPVGGSAGSIAIDETGTGYLGDNGFIHSGLYRFDATTLELRDGPGAPITTDPTSAVLPDNRHRELFTARYDFSAGGLIRWSLPDMVAQAGWNTGAGPVALSLWSAPSIDIALDPIGAPVAPGSRATVSGQLHNSTDEEQTGWVQIDAYRPDDSPAPGNPVLIAGPFVLPAGTTLTRSRTVRVPPAAPCGSYRLVARARGPRGLERLDTASTELEVQ